MENLLDSQTIEGINQGQFMFPLAADHKIEMVAVEDIAAFVVYAMENLGVMKGKEVDIASDKLSATQIAEVISAKLGRKIDYIQEPLAEIRGHGGDYIKMLKWLTEVGYDVNIPQLHRIYSRINWHSFEEWAQVQRWNRILKPIEISA